MLLKDLPLPLGTELRIRLVKKTWLASVHDSQKLWVLVKAEGSSLLEAVAKVLGQISR